MTGEAPLSPAQRQALLEAEAGRLLPTVSRKILVSLETRRLVDDVGRLTARGLGVRARLEADGTAGVVEVLLEPHVLARLDAELRRGEVPFTTVAKRFRVSVPRVRARARALGVSAPRRSVLAAGFDPG